MRRNLILAKTVVQIHKTLNTRQKTQRQSLCDKIIKERYKGKYKKLREKNKISEYGIQRKELINHSEIQRK